MPTPFEQNENITESINSPLESAKPQTGVGAGVGTAQTEESQGDPSVGRYKVGSELARGGMGIIYRGIDQLLGREVAIKVLQDKYGPNSGTARRFFDEARIAAQLQHPCIPPVHDLGSLADGRPFLAMKLIRGETLEDILNRRIDFVSDRGRFISVFEQVCQAIAYAHAHNVIHRDLKPANVMVGNFGEVQVMDWGLAKVLGKAGSEEFPTDPNETAAMTMVVSLRDSDGSFTQAGSVLGTPAFMPPEQAVGAVGKIDARSDVFGLGAILAVILTGKPPFVGSSSETVRVQAAQGNVEECISRLDSCNADPDLIELCKMCLSPKPADRPSNAGVVAKAVADLREAAEERIRQAELDKVRLEGEKTAATVKEAETKKRRRIQQLLAGTIAVFLLAGVSAGWWIDRQAERARLTEAEYEVEQERLKNEKKTAELVKAAQEQQLDNSAREALVEAEKLLQNGKPTEAAAALNKAEGVLAGGGLPATRQSASDLRREFDTLASLEDIAFAKEDVTKEGGSVPPVEIARKYALAFQKYGIDVLTLPESEAGAAISSRPIHRDLCAALVDWANLGTVDLPRVQKVLEVADLVTLEAKKAFDIARSEQNGPAMAQAASAIDPVAVPPGRLLAMASFLDASKESTAATNLLKRAQVAHPTDYLVASRLAQRLRTGSFADDLQQAYYYAQSATVLRPDSPRAWLVFGECAENLKQFEIAEISYRKAVVLRPTLGLAHSLLARVLGEQRKWPESVAELLLAIEVEPKAGWHYQNLGIAYENLGRISDADQAFQKTLEYWPDNEWAINTVASFYVSQKRWGDLERLYRSTVAKNPVWEKRRYAAFGDRFLVAGNLTLAEDAFRRELSIGGGEGALGLAIVAAKSGRSVEAVGIFANHEKVMELARLSYARLTELAEAIKASKQVAETLKSCNDVLEKDPNRSRMRVLLGYIQFANGDPEAIDTFLMALKQDPSLNSIIGYGLGRLFIDTGRLEEALTVWTQVVKENPRDADALVRLADTYRYQTRYGLAAAAYEEVMNLNPVQDEGGRTSTFSRLLEMYRESSRWPESVKAYLKWNETVMAANQAKTGKRTADAGLQITLMPLEAHLDAIIAGTEKPSDSTQTYQYGQIACFQQRYKAATQLFQSAISTNPGVHKPTRYRPHPAVSAARAGTGQGVDVATPEEQQVFRRLALEWLKRDFEHWKKQTTEKQKFDARRTYRLWLDLDDLAEVRDTTGLAKLSAEERKEWEEFWANVRQAL